MVPDITGTYLVEVVVNGVDQSYSVNLLGEHESTQGGFRVVVSDGETYIPAAGETLQFHATEGWHPTLDGFMRRVAARLPSVNQKADLVTLDGAPHGTVWFANSSGRVTRLLPGTAGYVMRTNGPGVDPSWVVNSAGGSSITLEDEGTPVSGAPHTTINFVGPGVAVTDAGAGVATVTISGGATLPFSGQGAIWYEGATSTILQLVPDSGKFLKSNGVAAPSWAYPYAVIQDEGSGVAGSPHSILNFVGAGVTVTDGTGGVATVTIAGASSYPTLRDEGGAVSGAPHSILNFVGAGVAVTDGGSGVGTITIAGGTTLPFSGRGAIWFEGATSTVVQLAPDSGKFLKSNGVADPSWAYPYPAIQDEGGALAGSPHATINFVGAGVTVTNVAGVATVTIPGDLGVNVVDTLQQTYDAGAATIAVSAAKAIAFSNTVDATDLLTLSRTFAGAGEALDITMAAAATGYGARITHASLGVSSANRSRGLQLENPTAATAGNPQFSPATLFRSRSFDVSSKWSEVAVYGGPLDGNEPALRVAMRTEDDAYGTFFSASDSLYGDASFALTQEATVQAHGFGFLQYANADSVGLTYDYVASADPGNEVGLRSDALLSLEAAGVIALVAVGDITIDGDDLLLKTAGSTRMSVSDSLITSLVQHQLSAGYYVAEGAHVLAAETEKTANYTLAAGDNLVSMNGSSIVLSLPWSATVDRQLWVINRHSTALTITRIANPGDPEGQPAVTVATLQQNDGVRLWARTANTWEVIARVQHAAGPVSATTGTFSGAITATTVTLSGQILAADGADGTPGYGFSAQAGVGVRRTASNTLALITNSTQKVTVSDTAIAAILPVSLASITNNVIGDLRLRARTADPTTPVEGDFWFHTTSNVLRYYDGAATQTVLRAADYGLDEAYDKGGSGAGRSITVDQGIVALTNNAANNNGVLGIIKTPAGTQSGVGLDISMGANATGKGLSIALAQTGLASPIAYLSRVSIGASPVEAGLTLANTSVAALDSQEFSPDINLAGSGWKTNATAAAQPVDCQIYARPIQGASSPSVNLVLSTRINAGSAVQQLAIKSEGSVRYRNLTADPATNIEEGDTWYRSDLDALKIYTSAARTIPFLETTNGNAWTGQQYTTPSAVTDAATIATDARLGNSFTVTIANNRTLGNPTNAVAGHTYLWVIRQDGTGGRTLSFDTNFDWGTNGPPGTAGGTPALDTTLNTYTLISGYAITSTFIFLTLAGTGII